MPLVSYNALFSEILHKPSDDRISVTKTKPIHHGDIVIKEIDVKSSLLLLKSNDNSILEQTLLHLNQIKDEEDVKLLENPDIIQRLLNILVKPDSTKCLIKLTLRLLTQLVKTDTGARVFCADVSTLDNLLYILHRTEDHTTLEMCLYILSILSLKREHCRYLKCSAEFFTEQLEHSEDIDIQYNCMKILENMLLHDIDLLPQTYWGMPTRIIFNLFKESQVERVQVTSLNILYLLRHAKSFYNIFPTEEMMDLFGGFSSILNLVENRAAEDQKIVLLYLMGTLPLQFIDMTSLKKIISLMQLYQQSPDVIKPCLNILVNLCGADHCQELVKSLNIGRVFNKCLVSENIQVSHIACDGVLVLCKKYKEHMRNIASNGAVLDHIFKTLLGEVDEEYKVRMGKLLLLLIDEEKCCEYIICKQNDKRSRDLNNSLGDKDKIIILLDTALKAISDDLSKTILNCLYKLTSRYECVGNTQLNTILSYFQHGIDQNKMKIELLIEILTLCLAKPTFINIFLDDLGLLAIDDYMKYQVDSKLLVTYGNLLTVACNYAPLAQIINDMKIFKWLNTNNLWEQPHWSRIISTLLDLNLPMKFAFSNVLTHMDITTNGFYAFKDLKCVNLFDFPPLDKMLRDRDHNKIVYVFTRDRKVSYKDHYIEKYISDISILLRHANNIHVKQLSQNSLTSGNEESDLIDYQIKQNAKQDIEIIATYVVNQMIGHGDDMDKVMYEEHLAELIAEQNSSVIPIGHVKMGFQFERAFLYKVMCDVFGYPCTLVRDEYGRDTHTEVCVEVLEGSVDSSEYLNVDREHKLCYYRVDLMTNPARLMPLNN